MALNFFENSNIGYRGLAVKLDGGNAYSLLELNVQRRQKKYSFLVIIAQAK